MRPWLALLLVCLLGSCDGSESSACEDGCAGTLVCVGGRCVPPGSDAGAPDTDAGPGGDAGPRRDAGSGPPAPPRPTLRWPFNGASTGSIHGSVVVPEPALMPRFDWDDSTGATGYDIEITSECSPSGFASCPFDAPTVQTRVSESELRAPLLEVDLAPPVGRRYFWRVRACAETCSAWTPPRYLDVGRQPNDFNGDGYADLLAGAYLDDGGADRAGRAYWWSGSATGPLDRRQIAAPRGEVEARFGLTTVALGDVNADGYADALITAYNADAGATNDGEAYLFLGSMDGLAATPDLTVPAPVAEDNAVFGRTAAPAGDVNGDGYADVVIGAHGENLGDSDLGRAYVFAGGPAGLVTPAAAVLEGPDRQSGQQFGFPVSGVGDVDGDGFADVLVGERRWDSAANMDAGRAHLFAGSSRGLSTMAARTFVDPTPTDSAELSWGLGGGGDIDGDHFADLLIGSRGREGIGGALYFAGGSAGPAATPDVVIPHPDPQADAEFGFAVAAVGDLNSDGFGDAVATARIHDLSATNEGRVYVFYGAASGVEATPSLVLDGSPVEGGAQFGYAAAAARDVDGDGVDDLVIGAINQDLGGLNHGAVHFYRGAAGGLSTTAVSLSTPRADGRLGSSVALTLPY